MEHVTNILLMIHFSRYAAHCHFVTHRSTHIKSGTCTSYVLWLMVFVYLTFSFITASQYCHCQNLFYFEIFYSLVVLRTCSWSFITKSKSWNSNLTILLTHTMNQVLCIHLCHFVFSLLSSLWPKNVQSLCKYVL
jgi:hypothetical protein